VDAGGPTTASDATVPQSFGWAVAVRGEVIGVGAPDDRSAGERAGAVYVFERRTGGWSQAAKLIASAAAPSTWFGNAVALSEHRIIVGMLLNGKGQRPGAAYVFARKQGVWTEVDRRVSKE